jgi:hypothetical protein
MSQAEQHFLETLHPEHPSMNDPGSIVISLLQNTEINVDKMKEEEKSLPPEDGKNKYNC